MKNLFHTESAFQRGVCDVGAARDSVRFASHDDPVFARKDVSVIRLAISSTRACKASETSPGRDKMPVMRDEKEGGLIER